MRVSSGLFALCQLCDWVGMDSLWAERLQLLMEARSNEQILEGLK